MIPKPAINEVTLYPKLCKKPASKRNTMIDFIILPNTGIRLSNGESVFLLLSLSSIRFVNTSITLQTAQINTMLTNTPIINFACIPKNENIGFTMKSTI